MKTDKELYRQLRGLPCDRLWDEVTIFNKALPAERMKRVAVIRAVGVVFSASGTARQRTEARDWLVALLRDPCEKIRRYAMAALPKIGAGRREEEELLALAQSTAVDREKKYLGRALDKIGGTATLESAGRDRVLLPQTEQKVKASVARKERPSSVRTDSTFTPAAELRIHLRCRKGLENILQEEIRERLGPRGKFRVVGVHRSVVAVTPTGPFSLADLYTLRCFATVNFVLGEVPSADNQEALAAAIASPLSQRLLKAFTDGSIRYRLEFISKGHQRGAVRQVVNRAYALCPEILNDARSAPWSVDVHPAGPRLSVELRPRLSPDPRFYYRKDDIAAASHPPLAACMARLAGRVRNEIVWDPFCGSGLELIESALLGGVQSLYGTDLSAEAIAVARTNLAAAKLPPLPATFTCCDFRDYAAIKGLGPGSVTLMITNPPMGRRVRVPQLRALFADLFSVAATVLKPGGRLVFANPVRIQSRDPSLKLEVQQVVDLGGFDCRLEKYIKSAV